MPKFLSDIGCGTHPGDLRLRDYAKLLDRVGSDERRYYWIAVAIVKAKGGDVPTRAEYSQWLSKRSTDGRAAQLLLEAGWSLPLSDSDIKAAKELIPVAGRINSKRLRWTERRVGQSRKDGLGIPTAENIAKQWELHIASRKAYQQRVRARDFERFAPEMVAVAKRDSEAVRKFVEDVRRETGTGPTWREVSEAMGWPSGGARTEIALRYLIGSGVLISDERVRRSLDVAPRS